MARVRWPLAALCLLPATVAAQQPQQHPQSTWTQLPRMQLERQFAGLFSECRVAENLTPAPALLFQGLCKVNLANMEHPPAKRHSGR
jgi:hypothetical protein